MQVRVQQKELNSGNEDDDGDEDSDGEEAVRSVTQAERDLLRTRLMECRDTALHSTHKEGMNVKECLHMWEMILFVAFLPKWLTLLLITVSSYLTLLMLKRNV